MHAHVIQIQNGAATHTHIAMKLDQITMEDHIVLHPQMVYGAMDRFIWIYLTKQWVLCGVEYEITSDRAL